MALFSRRSMQALLDAAEAFVPNSVLTKFVTAFNELRSDYLALEWELATLIAFNQAGTQLKYEQAIGGRNPDFSLITSDGTHRITADITTISDSGLRKLNPYEELSEELVRRVRKLKRRPPGGFHISVGGTGNHPAWRGGERVRLKIPPVNQFRSAVFNQDFNDFMRLTCECPQQPAKYIVADKHFDITIAYDPKSTSWGGDYAVFTLSHNMRNNPLFNALTAKLHQLRAARSDSITGVVVCDGDCDMLRRNSSSWSGSEFSVQEIVNEFFRQHQWVGFVMTVTILGIPGSFRADDVQLTTNLFLNRRIPSPIATAVEKAYRDAIQNYPQPIRTAPNARYHLDWLRKQGNAIDRPYFEGGFQLSDRHIKISAGTVLQLLAGQISPDEFTQTYNRQGENLFLWKVRAGYTISGASVESGGLKDDDWIIFQFAPVPDPAASPFRTRSDDDNQ